MLIVFSICSILYALFYAIIGFEYININYVENIISLNMETIKKNDLSLENQESEVEIKK
jgi:hypothetical protein